MRPSLVAAVAFMLALPPLAASASPKPADRAARLCTRGARHLESGNLQAARRAFARASELAPDLPEAADGLGRVALADRHYAEALAQLRRAADLYSIRATRIAGQNLEVADDLERLQRDFSAYGVTGSPCSGTVLFYDQLTPREIYADGSDPLPPGLRFRIGVCLLRLGRPEEARAALREELEHHPRTAAAHVNLAVCELALGNAPAALSELQAASRLGATVPTGLEDEIRRRLP